MNINTAEKEVDFVENDNSQLITEKPKRGLVYLAVFSSLFGSLIMGTSMGYTATALPTMQLNNSGLHIGDDEASWIGSLPPIGALFGGLVAGACVDFLGRKGTLIWACPPCVASWLLIILCQHFSNPLVALYFGRFLTGFCTGLVSLATPVYITEIAAPRNRGLLGSFHQLCNCAGILMMYLIGTFLNWKWLALTAISPPLLLIILMCFMPETPQWLLSKDKHSDARRSVVFLHGNTPIAELIYQTSLEAIQDSSKERISLREALSREIMIPFVLCLGLSFFQQWCGISAFVSYSVDVFKPVQHSIEPNTATIILGFLLVAFTFVSSLLVDRAGRKGLLCFSGTTMSVCLILMGTYFFLADEHGDSFKLKYGLIPAIALFVYTACFSFAFGSIPWLMMGELLPLRARGIASGFVTCFNWGNVFLVCKLYIDLVKWLNYSGTYWLFGGITIFSNVFVWFCVPETKGKSLEEIENSFKRNKRSSSL